MDGVVAGRTVADGEHRAPLGEAGAGFTVLDQALAEAVEALGDGLVLAAVDQRLDAPVDLDARDHAPGGQALRERLAVQALLEQGFLEQDHAAGVLLEAGRGEQQIAVGLAVGLGVLDTDLVETLLDGAGGLVGGQQALAGGDHRQSGFAENLFVHG